jgi:hypothetical protein
MPANCGYRSKTQSLPAAGLPTLNRAAYANGANRQARAEQHAAAVGPMLSELVQAGLNNREIALDLNRRGVPSPSGCGWHKEQVRRTVGRLKVNDALPV